MKWIPRLAVSGLLYLLLASGAFAQTTNSWIDPGGGYSGNWTDGTHWDIGVPTSADAFRFTNAQTSAYTVTFTGPVNTFMGDTLNDKVIFDLAGFAWTNTYSGPYAVSTVYRIGSNGAPAEVTFTSTGSQGIVHFGTGYPDQGSISYATITITNAKVNLGPETGINNSTILVDGPTAELLTGTQTIYDGLGGTLTVRNGAQATIGSLVGAYGGPDTVITVSNGSTLSTGAGLSVGWGYGARLVVSNSTLNVPGYYASGNGAGGLVVGVNRVYTATPWEGDLEIDGSTVNAQEMNVGVSGVQNGRAVIKNGSTVILSNGFLTVRAGNYGANTNTLVLNGSTIKLGAPTGVTNIWVISYSPYTLGTNFNTRTGWLTNSGIMKAMGTITGLGIAPAQVVNAAGGSLEIGGSIGTLVLNNADLKLDAGSQTLFEFSDTALDQIILNGGSASVLGSNLFSLAAGSALPAPGVKWGLGAYNFVVGDSVTWNPQYDDLTNVLASYGLVQNLDYRYGIFNIGGGLQALRLEFVPEPSTVLLLVGGGLVLWRFRRRK
ncbi:PEP-CTERM sorting domain-containing protein [bacterium]|nr:PEP-CTERM sorting domain-containing protein [bacterium]